MLLDPVYVKKEKLYMIQCQIVKVLKYRIPGENNQIINTQPSSPVLSHLEEKTDMDLKKTFTVLFETDNSAAEMQNGGKN